MFSLVAGGVLLVASLFGADQDADADADINADVDIDADAGHDGLAHGDLGGFVAVFISLRFWTFFATFFGLTGSVLSWLQLAEPMVTLTAAVGMGSVSGYAAAAIIRALTHDEIGTVASSADYAGQSARVLLPFGRGGTGKVRLDLKGTTVDVLATTDEEVPFAANDEALVVEMQGMTAFVTRTGPARLRGSSGDDEDEIKEQA